MLNNIDAIIFDMDGTLIDSMWVWTQVDKDFLGERGLSMPASLQKEIEGYSFDQTADYFLKTFPLDMDKETLKQIWIDMSFRAYETKVPFKPGALQFLKKVKEMGLKTGIATSNSRILTETVGKNLGFLPYIDCIITSEEVPNGKPEPDIYLTVAKRLCIPPDKCLVFEDIPNGILAGKRAGMKTCAVWDDFSRHLDEEKKSMADYYIKDYFDILSDIQHP